MSVTRELPRCPKCRTMIEDIGGHRINRCEDAPVVWWVRSQHPRYNGREVWEACHEWSIRRELQRGSAFRLGRLCDLEALGLVTPSTRGPNGRRLCCWCGREVAPRRQTWCSNDCVEDYRMHHEWGYIRERVRKRDGAVCWSCGVNAEEAARWWERIHKAYKRLRLYRLEGRYAEPWRGGPVIDAKRRVGWPDWRRDHWEADHIHARADGGTDHPDNLRTLCVPCHKARTKRQQHERAKRRRAEKADLFQGAAK